MEARRSVLVAHPAERMFDLIEAAEHYPDFLPWCAGATVLQRDDALVVARLQVAYLGARFEFTTRNPKRRPEFMAIGLEEGPFRRFEGTWHLKPLASWGCRIEFALSYDFASTVMGKLASPVFHRIADTLVDAFIQRADSVYGPAADAGTQDTAAAQGAPSSLSSGSPTAPPEPPQSTGSPEPSGPGMAQPKPPDPRRPETQQPPGGTSPAQAPEAPPDPPAPPTDPLPGAQRP